MAVGDKCCWPAWAFTRVRELLQPALRGFWQCLVSWLVKAWCFHPVGQQGPRISAAQALPPAGFPELKLVGLSLAPPLGVGPGTPWLEQLGGLPLLQGPPYPSIPASSFAATSHRMPPRRQIPYFKSSKLLLPS